MNKPVHIGHALMFLAATQTWVALAGEPANIYAIPVKRNGGVSETLAPLQGKVLLIVNTASQCGYTPQYSQLEELYQKYQAQGLSVLGFPSNDFGGQEPGSDAEIRYFCQSNYHVDFPLFTKGAVSGKRTQPLFQWLLAKAPSHDPIAWNFEKFLVNRKGVVVARFKSDVDPTNAELTRQIEKTLKEPR